MKPAPVQPTLFDPPKGDCPMCRGTGSVYWTTQDIIPPRYADMPVPDSGRGLKLPCPNCGGSGSPEIPF